MVSLAMYIIIVLGDEISAQLHARNFKIGGWEAYAQESIPIHVLLGLEFDNTVGRCLQT